MGATANVRSRGPWVIAYAIWAFALASALALVHSIVQVYNLNVTSSDRAALRKVQAKVVALEKENGSLLALRSQLGDLSRLAGSIQQGEKAVEDHRAAIQGLDHAEQKFQGTLRTMRGPARKKAMGSFKKLQVQSIAQKKVLAVKQRELVGQLIAARSRLMEHFRGLASSADAPGAGDRKPTAAGVAPAPDGKAEGKGE